MTMPADEKAIIAGFRTMEKAQSCANELKSLGVLDMRIDRMSYFPVEKLDHELHNPITGKFPGLANAIYNQDMNKNARILSAVTPSASGLSDGNDENIGTDVVLTVVVHQSKFDQAEKITRAYGGQF